MARWVTRATGVPISGASISRLESQPQIPFDQKRRRIAFLLSMLYELDPTELELEAEDGPDGDDGARIRSALTAASTAGEGPYNGPLVLLELAA